MKIGSIGNNVNFSARFTKESYPYLAFVKGEAERSGRMDEYLNAKQTIAFNFPNGVITKVKADSRTDVFRFTPNEPVNFYYQKDNSQPLYKRTSELDSFIRLADDIRNLSL